MILSLGVLKTLCSAIVNSITPNVGARCPPISVTVSIVKCLNSSANLSSCSLSSLRKSSGDFIFGKILSCIIFFVVFCFICKNVMM